MNILITWFNIDNTPYLSDCSQRIKINNNLSESFNLSGGVPQGSCIGPVAFLAYIIYIYDIMNYHLPSIFGCADDTQLQLSYVKKAVIEIENCIAKLRECMFLLNLKLNDTKTESLIIDRK